MPEAGIGIGRYRGEFGGLPQELLTWYNERGERHLSAAEAAQQEVIKGQVQNERLRAFLRSQGFDPDNLPTD